MINVNGIINVVKKKEPERTVTAVYDMNKDFYLVEAVLDPSTVEMTDPYYIVSKKTAEVGSFNPAMNYELFFKALNSEPLYSLNA